MVRTLFLAALWFFTVAAFAPLLVAVAAGGTAASLGCAVDEGAAHPCRFGAWDIGDWLQTGLVAGGWLSIVAAPGMLLAAGIWAGLLWRRQWRRPPQARGR